MINNVVLFFVALLYSNFGEYCLHKYVLHGKSLGKKKGSFWSFHWSEHHNNCRKYDFYDPDYERFPLGLHAQGKEVTGLLFLACLHSLLLPLSISFVLGVWSWICLYYYVHRKSHLDVLWGKKWLRHHYDHHMNSNQDANWCVTVPVADYILGTREKED